MPLASKNPATEEVIKTYPELKDDEILSRLMTAESAFNSWKLLSIKQRLEYVEKLIPELESKKDEIAKIMTLEMGKPIKQGVGEVDKCILLINHYIQNAEKYLKPEKVDTEAKDTFVRFDPLGVILSIMPWNFPFWQAIRCIVPNIIAGNTVVLKHASNVPQSSELIELIFNDAGIPAGVFQNLHIGSAKVEMVLRDNRVKGVALTGSENAGKQVARIAGEELKKCVMELGGSDPFIVLADADIDAAVKAGMTSRTRNNGQACNAAKRFIVDESIYEDFIGKFIEAFKTLKVGDPMDGATDIGPLVNEQALKDIEELVDESVKMGAKVLLGGKKGKGKGYYYEPSVILINEDVENINREIPLYKEEAFAPVATVIKVKSVEHAVQIANDTKFGLGASIWTRDEKLGRELIERIDAGSVYVNSMVSSDPRTPFGGIKISGYGREMGKEGIREFTNVKTVLIK
jgi:succinate-semialdehyde dehydrogenase/glutarate-semialdehyde dehydrogenase